MTQAVLTDDCIEGTGDTKVVDLDLDNGERVPEKGVLGFCTCTRYLRIDSVQDLHMIKI